MNTAKTSTDPSNPLHLDQGPGSTTPRRNTASAIAYLLIGALILGLRLLVSLFPDEQIASQMVNLTDSLSIGAIWVVGWVGVILAPGTGFTAMWGQGISWLKRFLYPFLIGEGFAILAIIFDLIHPLGDESLIKFPASLAAYPLAGILEEILFRLFLTTALVWIFSNMLLRGKAQVVVFWVVTAFLGIFYTLTQLDLFSNLMGSLDLLTTLRFFITIAANFIVAAYLYRKYGFLSAISMRLGDYLVWHVLWGAIAKG